MKTKYALTIVDSNGARNSYELNARTISEAMREAEQHGTYPGDCLQIWDGNTLMISKCDRHSAQHLNQWAKHFDF